MASRACGNSSLRVSLDALSVMAVQPLPSFSVHVSAGYTEAGTNTRVGVAEMTSALGCCVGWGNTGVLLRAVLSAASYAASSSTFSDCHDLCKAVISSDADHVGGLHSRNIRGCCLLEVTVMLTRAHPTIGME